MTLTLLPSPPLTFAQLVRQYRTRLGISQNELGRRTPTDAAYVNRIERERGGPVRPGQHIVMLMAEALELDAVERDCLLVAAGYKPASVSEWTDVLAQVAGVLNDDRLSAATRMKFELIVLAAVRLVGES